MLERLVALELEDEDGNVQLFNIKRVITRETNLDGGNPDSVFSNVLHARPGGMIVASRFEDARTMTTIDDPEREAFERGNREMEEMRSRGMQQARTGGEGGVLPDEARVPSRRGRRGTRKDQQQTEQTVES